MRIFGTKPNNALGVGPEIVPMVRLDDLQVGRRGFLFATPSTEAGYRRWRVIDALQILRGGVVASMGGWALGIAGFYVGAPELFAHATALILGVMFPPMLAVLMFSLVPRLQPCTMLASTLGNFVSGYLTIYLGVVLLQNYTLTSGLLLITIFTGSTIFRMSPGLTALAGAPCVVSMNYLLVMAFERGTIARIELAACVGMVTVAFLMGMVVCLVIDRIARQTYKHERVIERQQQALVEERANLSKFLSPEVARMVRERGIEATLVQETLNITVVCCDLRGFTAYTVKHGAQEMAAVLRDYYETVIEVAKRYGGTVKDFAGDGALILIGAPIPRADHAVVGLELARDLLMSMQGLIGRFHSADTPLGIGAGIASGPCAVGAIGSQSRLEYTAVGPAVNLAARLCGQAGSGQLLIDMATADVASGRNEWQGRKTSLKGFDEPVSFLVEDVLA